jgi:predicted ABC-type ATPase
MAMYVSGESGELGQFASNAGFTALIESSAHVPELKAFFDKASADERGDVDTVCARLRSLKAPKEVKSTASGLADMIDGEDVVFITNGTHDDSVDKFGDDQTEPEDVNETPEEPEDEYEDADKFDPDQARDDHGRWAGGGEDKGKEQDRIRAVLNAADSDPKVKAAEENNLRAGDSRLSSGVLDANGHYTPEADAVNREIADSFLDPAAKPAEGEKPSAVFMVGKPGAGKSTTLENMKDTFPKSVTINSDDIKAMIPGYTPDQAAAYHERSCDIARSYLTPAAVGGGYNVVFDMTDNSDRLMQSVKALKESGYKVGLIHADVSDATSVERVYARFQKTGRYVAPRTALSYRGRPKMAYDLAKPHVDQYREYDQNEG